MLRAFAVARPVAAAARSSLRASAASRSFATTTRRASDDHHGPTAPQLYGKGSNEPKIPSDADQATGIERLQLLGKMEGVDVFDMHPLDSSRLGTMQDPIKVVTYVSWHIFFSALFELTMIGSSIPIV